MSSITSRISKLWFFILMSTIFACSPTPAGNNNNSDCQDANLCNNQCVDLNSDPLNCGVCGNACQEGWNCTNGECTDNNGYYEIVAKGFNPTATAP